MKPYNVRAIAPELGLDPNRVVLEKVHGGDIARSYRLADDERGYFLKCMVAADAAVLEAERAGLEALSASGHVRVPAVAGSGRTDDMAWLALEWLDMRPRTRAADGRLGEQLSRLHALTYEAFGWDRDNFIGRTPQPNPRCADWVEFFFTRRLDFQLELLAKAHPQDSWVDWKKPLKAEWQRRFDGYRPAPSFIHGDLWGGNASLLPDDEPVIYDPAVHHADRECDLAMADLFGGFSVDFFAAYRAAWPLEPEHRERQRYYQLYHLLNHANLFGGHYVSVCRKLVRDLSGSISAR